MEYRKEYPRPDFEREQWECLNGTWEFRFGQEEWRTIEVPFAFQSKMSGVDDNRMCDYITYKRLITVPKEWRGKKDSVTFWGC